MKRTIIAGTIVLLGAVFVGSFIGLDHTLLVLTSPSIEFQVVRIALVALMAMLLASNPPRSIDFRTVLGAVSAVLSLGTAVMLVNYQIGIFDAILFLQVAVIFALEAAETQALVKRPVKKIPVAYRS